MLRLQICGRMVNNSRQCTADVLLVTLFSKEFVVLNAKLTRHRRGRLGYQGERALAEADGAKLGAHHSWGHMQPRRNSEGPLVFVRTPSKLCLATA